MNLFILRVEKPIWIWKGNNRSTKWQKTRITILIGTRILWMHLGTKKIYWGARKLDMVANKFHNSLWTYRINTISKEKKRLPKHVLGTVWLQVNIKNNKSINQHNGRQQHNWTRIQTLDGNIRNPRLVSHTRVPTRNHWT